MNVEMGWTAGSTMFNTYVNLAGVNTDNKKRSLAGLQIIEPIKAGIKTKECPRCHRVNPEDADRCLMCRTAISQAEIDKESAIEEAKKIANKNEMEQLKAEIIERAKKEAIAEFTKVLAVIGHDGKELSNYKDHLISPGFIDKLKKDKLNE